MDNANQKGKIRIFIVPILFIALLTALDQLTKAIIVGNFALYESKDIIKDVFSLTYIRNEGIAWGMFAGRKIIFLIVTFAVLLLAFYIFYNIADDKRFLWLRVCLVFLISGAIGNMIDRIKLGYVIDFFSFDLINFPVFNVADIYVVCSMIVIFLLVLFYYNDDDLAVMLKKPAKD